MTDDIDKPLQDRILDITLRKDYEIASEHYMLFHEEVKTLDDEALIEEVQVILEGLVHSEEDMDFSGNAQAAMFQYFFTGILTPENRKTLEGIYILVYGKGAFTEDQAYRRVLFTPDEVEAIYGQQEEEESEEEE